MARTVSRIRTLATKGGPTRDEEILRSARGQRRHLCVLAELSLGVRAGPPVRGNAVRRALARDPGVRTGHCGGRGNCSCRVLGGLVGVAVAPLESAPHDLPALLSPRCGGLYLPRR